MAQLANASDSESEDWGFKSLCGNNRFYAIKAVFQLFAQKFSSGRMVNASPFEGDTLTGLQVRVLWGDQNNMGIKRPCIKNVGKKIPFDIS